MVSDNYQKEMSLKYPVVLDRQAKAVKAQKMVAVLKDAGLLSAHNESVAVDVGCSAGLLTRAITPFFGRVIGCDIDTHALRIAKGETQSENEIYIMADTMHLPLATASVDLVICNHVYEHVPSAGRLFAEIHRILKPDGVCYLGAASRLTPIEPHYRLPFLSWLPKPLAHLYMRATGRGGHYYENLRTYWGLKGLLRNFVVQDYTLKVIADPEKFDARDVISKGSFLDRIPLFVWRLTYAVLPSYILLLRKAEPRY